ncbi:HPP family protein [Sphingomonas sp.]|uniref:HPP family protein n=1 Tax=Sphingomonas sp. TaxID=28214 RepID=UPI002DD64219|nr:HPP family protein [Sphingomonas sp.]
MTAFRQSLIFRPKLAGGRLDHRLVAALGAFAGIAATAWVLLHLPLDRSFAALIAPMGASAVLVFAVPTSPLAQPWSVLGGNVVSGAIGIAMALIVPEPWLAAGLAVGVAIATMTLLRCLHPPGGAVALGAVTGGPAIAAMGLAYPLVLVAVNATLLIAAGWAFHRLSGHSWPHRPGAGALPTPRPLHRADIDAALADLGETFDIAPEDLDLLLQRAEHHARTRR